jgi:isoleucyl-tRNA synthetase
VKGDGRYAADLPLFGGLKIWDANPKIVDKLRETGALLHAEKITHSYMHCWRHRTPIIYRATTQWFAGMDDVPGYQGVKPSATLRSVALAGIEATQFFPSWGKSRLYGMIANRPDWTLSRQRMGNADPVFRRQGNRGITRTPARRAAAAGSSAGIESVRIDARGLRRRCREVTQPPIPWIGSIRDRRTKPKRSIPSCAFRPTLSRRSDQHAGGSILRCSPRRCSTARRLQGAATHGFAVDGSGKKMSKSKGNVVAPQKIWNALGAEILRRGRRHLTIRATCPFR